MDVRTSSKNEGKRDNLGRRLTNNSQLTQDFKRVLFKKRGGVVDSVKIHSK